MKKVRMQSNGESELTSQRLKASDASPKRSRQYVSDEEMRALTATFTEMASSAGRVAESLSRINALAEEIHVELRATGEALAAPRRCPVKASSGDGSE